MDGTTAFTMENWMNDNIIELTKPWPKEANNLSLQKIFRFCLERDSDDDNIFRQHTIRQRDLNFAYRNFIDDTTLLQFYLHIHNSLLEGDEITKDSIPCWIDNASFLSSEHFYKLKK